MSFSWWHWIAIGLLLVLAEMMMPAFYLIWFGLGALVLGVVMLAVPMSMTAQLLAWTILSTLFVLLWFRYLKPRTLTQAGQASAIIGEIGLLTRAVAPFERGEVRFQKPVAGADVWPCIADQPIAAGQRVRVVAVEGNLFKITTA
jgi:membrane protein implicated in regulation of membrane protease activity